LFLAQDNEINWDKSGWFYQEPLNDNVYDDLKDIELKKGMNNSNPKHRIGGYAS